jgi:tRNA/rRNA methyltransferase
MTGAGTNRNAELLTGGPAIILVEPQLGENIGMAARAMANFGLSNLRLVRPRERWLHAKTRAASAGAVFSMAHVSSTVSSSGVPPPWCPPTSMISRRKTQAVAIVDQLESSSRIKRSKSCGTAPLLLLTRT